MNSMCDFTQFVISSVVRNINAEVLAKTFMEDVPLFLGMTELVVVFDADIKFRSIFEEMFNALNIHFWLLAQGNHKGLLFERYHHYLNKTQTIAEKDRGTHLSILRNAKMSQYVWNITPINNTDVPCSLSAFGREF